jgi:hypothetical protein
LLLRLITRRSVAIYSIKEHEKPVENICRTSLFRVRSLRRIRKLLSESDAKSVVTTFVSSRIDYCNSLLYGTSTANINKLQRVQSDYWRTLLFTCVTYSHRLIQWLSIPARIEYRLAVTSLKTLLFRQPTYLYSILSQHKPLSTLIQRSFYTPIYSIVVTTLLLVVPFSLSTDSHMS